MPFIVPIDQASNSFPAYTFVEALTPSEQKAAFHVRDNDGRDLCLKIISPDARMEYVQREIIALQSLTHPNVVQLIEHTLSTKEGRQRHYMIEEFVDGQDFSALLSPDEQWPTKRAIDFFSQLFDGLSALDGISVVHRDLKPSNIRVRRNGSPVIIDFGLARHLTLTDLTRTSEGAAIGTPLYFAPEQFVGSKNDIDHRTDLFASGVLIYQAMVGRHPFFYETMSYSELLNAVCTSSDHLDDPKFTSLDKRFQIIISKLLEKERAHRPAHAAQVAAILRKIGGPDA